jgi:RNA polymerase sigma-70 factor (ECF subfamily)
VSDSARLATFHTIYERYAADVYRFALYLNGNPAQAQDVTSETFLRAWASPEPVRNETVKAYLLTIARNLITQEQRTSWRRQELDEKAPAPGSIEVQASAREQLRRAVGQIDTFPEVQRNALLLRAVEGLSYNEISQVLGIPVATAKCQVHRARLKLAESLQTKTTLENRK